MIEILKDYWIWFLRDFGVKIVLGLGVRWGENIRFIRFYWGSK